MFPMPYSTLLAADDKMEVALQAGLAEVGTVQPSLDQVAISIVAVEGLDDFRHAGRNFGQTHYSASLLKVVIPYCAYQLRMAVEDVGNAAGAADAASTFEAAHASIDIVVTNAVPEIVAAGIAPAARLPKYEQMFAVIRTADGAVSVQLGAAFETSMRDALVNSCNSAAAAAIKQLGYGWINGALAAGGFFLEAGQQGIWLCGTYDGSLPAVRIPSQNDGPSAQATTTFDLANLYAHILRGSLVSTAESQEIAQLLADTANGPEPSWMDRRRDTGSRQFNVTHTKIGVGPLKSGANIFSEGSVVEAEAGGPPFIVVWQNVRESQLSAMSKLVESAIRHYLAP